MRNLYASTWLWLAILASTTTSLFRTPTTSLSPSAACNVTVNAGNDQTLCDTGQVVNLQATINGTYLSAAWSPSTGLADSSILATTAVVNTTTTYRMTVRSINDQNLITNGNFDAGNTGFTSDYQYDSLDIFNDGKYAVVRRANDVRNSFQNCRDRSGSGFMMVVNASGQPNRVWCQTITVSPNTEYLFSAWAASMVSENPARLQFSINNTLIGNIFTAPTSTCTWREFTANWRSNAATTAQICIANVNNTPRGNDFAIDDLSFRQICETTDSVTITVADLNADWVAPDTLCNDQPGIDLNSLLVPTATPGGTWTIDGTPNPVLNARQLTPGNHQVNYTVQTGTCIENLEQTVTVVAAANAGSALAPLAVCAGTDTVITLANLLQNEDPGGVWTEISTLRSTGTAFNAANGTFRTVGQIADTFRFRYSIDAPGACPDVESTVEVILNTAPLANAGNDLELNCLLDMVTIGTNAPNSNFRYVWTAANGSPIMNPDLPLTEVEQADTYILSVTNPANGCSDQDSVVVSSSISQPTATLEIKQLTCNQTKGGAIRVTATGEGPFQYALDGNSFSSKNEFQSLMPGNYFITVRDKNGCDTVLQAALEQPEALDVDLQVNLQNDPPTLVMGDSAQLTILTSKPAASIISVAWSPDSLACNTCTTATIRPRESTTYSVRVTDANGCVATAQLLLFVQQLQRVYIPNAFSPNGDGNNDFFYISAAQEVKSVKTFHILNRWGTLVYSRSNFQPNDPTAGWNGMFNGKVAPNAVYVYVAELELADGRIVVIKGDVTVVN
jgi:gliding motility-associated-like protein